MSPASVTVEYTGPFFANDPGQKLNQNIRRALGATAEYALKTVRELTPAVTGETRTNMRTRAYARFSTAEAYGSDRTTYIRAFWLETGRRRATAGGGHRGISTKWVKSAAKRSGDLVYMKKSPPRPYHKAASHVRRKALADIKAELLKGIEP